MNRAPVNPLSLHWKKSRKDFDNALVQLRQRISNGPVHDIRVAIKQFNAFLDLYILLKNEPEWKWMLTNTNQLFTILGKHRDVAICQELTISFEKKGATGSCKEWTNYLQGLWKTTRTWANQAIHRYHKKELLKIALLLKQDSSLPVEDKFTAVLSELIQAQLTETKKHFREPHRVRRSLKKVYYWIDLFPADKQLSWHRHELHQLLHDLGCWQDNELFLTRIKHFRKDYLPRSFGEYGLLKDMEANARENKKILLRSAYTTARGWLKKVSNTPVEV